VPALLVALRVAAAIIGQDSVARLGEDLASALPSRLGAPEVAATLVERGARLSPLSTVAAVLPATLYGEGLRRACLALGGRGERLTGWRGRAGALLGLLMAPLLVLCVLFLTPWLARQQNAEGQLTFLGVYVAFLVDWLVVSAVLAYAYRVISPARPGRRALVLGGLATGSVVAGFVQGFVLFLALPLDLGAPFGGFDAVGAAVAVLLWLWLLHALALVGYEVTLALDEPAAAAR
jgi:membrane protein